jgi:hypothetical protein
LSYRSKLGAPTRNASRNDNDVCSCQSLLHAIIGREVAGNFLSCLSNETPVGSGRTYGYRGDMGKVGCDAGSIDDIEEGELVD